MIRGHSRPFFFARESVGFPLLSLWPASQPVSKMPAYGALKDGHRRHSGRPRLVAARGAAQKPAMGGGASPFRVRNHDSTEMSLKSVPSSLQTCSITHTHTHTHTRPSARGRATLTSIIRYSIWGAPGRRSTPCFASSRNTSLERFARHESARATGAQGKASRGIGLVWPWAL